jgi:hypothetical protein
VLLFVGILAFFWIRQRHRRRTSKLAPSVSEVAWDGDQPVVDSGMGGSVSPVTMPPPPLLPVRAIDGGVRLASGDQEVLPPAYHNYNARDSSLVGGHVGVTEPVLHAQSEVIAENRRPLRRTPK